jgi:HlyD family secretion protein
VKFLRELFLVALLLSGTSAWVLADDEPQTDEPQKEEAAETDQEPKTHTVEAGPFKVEVTLEGVFEAQTAHEILLQPEVWSTLKVENVAEEGETVEEGDLLLKLETEQIDDEIRDQKFALDLSRLSREQAIANLKSLQKSVPLDMEAAQRSHRIAQEELDYFLNVTEQQRKESAEESLKSSTYSVEYAQEELDQLEQMYKADDLTEQTEEIILKRAQRDVERAEYFLDLAQTRFDRTMEMDLPREKQQVEESAVRAEIALRKADATLPSSLDKERIELEKLNEAHRKLTEKLEHLQDDRRLLTVKSPGAGVVYYGQADRGKWTTAATVRKQLRPGGTVSANSVIMTVVSTEPGFVRVDIPEKDYRHFREGAPVSITPTAFPDLSLSGECGERAPVAVSPGTFDGRIDYEPKEGQPQPLPGMTCKVTITAYSSDSALTVPSSAVFGEEDDRHVFVKDGEESRKQPVETGETSDGKTEITKGLAEGDVILLEKP